MRNFFKNPEGIQRTLPYTPLHPNLHLVNNYQAKFQVLKYTSITKFTILDFFSPAIPVLVVTQT